MAEERNWRQVFAEELEKLQEKEAARPRKHPVPASEISEVSEIDPASGWLESDDFESPVRGDPDEDRDRRRRSYSRQVGIRLSHPQYTELCHAADLYGVAPGTMARMLVRRGSRAVLDARQRYDLQLGEFD